MKHTVRKIGLLLLLLGLLSTFCFAQTSEAALTGDGSAASPYLISDESGLRQLAADVNGGNSFSGSHFRLTGDLVLTESWTPIGTASTPFCGTFDGNGCTVSGMTGEGTYLGLFAHLGSGAVVENVHLTEVSLTGASYLAGIAAYADAGTGSITVSNCTVSGTLRDDAEDYPDGYLGGIIGYANAETGSLTVSDCSVSGSIYCDYRSGGILGYGEGASSRSIRILNCTNHAYIGAGNNGNSCGGIAGYLSYAVVERCMNYASVSGNAYSEDNGSSWLGGIVGEGGGVIFNGCGNYGDVSTFFAGGISPSQYGAHQANSCLNIGDMEHSSDGYGRAIIYSGSASNCYYLVGTGNGIDGATGVSSIEMESGAVAHALRDYFGQTLGVDPYPVPLTADNRVYEVTVIGEARGTFYVNGGDTVELPAVSDCTAYFDGEEKFDPSTPITRDYALAAKGYHNYVDGVCIYCGNEGVNYVDVGTCGASTAWVLTESGTLTISGSGAMLDYDGADAPWKAYGADIRSVIIGKGVTNIGNYAFSGLPNVTSVSIADTVTVIGDYAFYGYDGITDFTVGDNVTEIGEYAFAYWTGLTNLTLGSRLQTIGSHAFYMCSGLDYVEIPSSVTTVGSSAFRKCTALDYLYLRSGLAVIGDYAFSETAITSLNVPATVTAIGDYALADCSALELVTFLGAAPQIGANAFSGNTVRCELPNYDSSWDYNVQQNFGGTLTWSMGSGTCGSGLTWVLDFTGTLTVSGTGKMNSFDVYNGASQAPWGALAEKVRSVVIGEGVTSIGDYAFYGCTNLSSVSIADSVTEIGRESSFTGYGHGCVFYNCTSLTQITIPKNVRFIAPSSFAKCPGLMSIDVAYGNTSFSSEDGILYSRYKTELRCYPGGKGGAFTVPSSVTAITPYAFAYNEKLLSVTIPASVAEIEEYAFAYCYGLESVIFEGSAPTFGSYVFNGVTAEATCPASDTTWTLAVMKNCGSSLTWNVGSGACGTGVQWELIYSGVNTDLTVSGSGAMADYTSGTQPWAAYITNITSFTVEDGVTSVGAYILEKATALRRVTLADSVTSIGNSAFDHCTALWNVSLGNGIRTIGESAFYNTAITSMDFPDSLQSVDRYAFYYCTSLKTLTFGSGMQSIGYTAFASCTALQTVDLGSSLTTLEQSAFNGCSNLTKIVIPATVTTVGTYAFRNCTALQYVEFLGNAPTINTSAFGGTTCYAYYLASKSGWTSSVLTNYGGTVTWGALSQRGTCGSKTEWLLSAAGELYICGSGAINSYSEANPAPWDSFRANIKKISLRGVSSIGAYAFHGCGALTEAIVPSGVYSIGDYAFAGCEKLQVVLFEGSAPSFAANTFSGTACEMWYASAWSSSVCKDYGGTLTWRKTTSRGTSGSAVRWAMDSTGTLVLLGSGNMSTYSSSYRPWYDIRTSILSVIVGGEVTNISNGAFSGCTALKTATIHGGVTSIGTTAFGSCSALESVTFLGSAPSISYNAFTGVTATAGYPLGNTSWTSSKRSNYGGTLTWEAVCLNHSEAVAAAVAPTCTASGLTEGVYCTKCSAFLVPQEEIPALGHYVIGPNGTEVPADTITPDCSISYTCTVCQEIAIEASGHRVLGTVQVETDPLTVTNSTSYPFSLSDNTYYSTNKTDNSSSSLVITAKYGCTLTLRYGVSSEEDYDKLSILLNGTTKDTISGEVSDQSMTLSLAAGDTVTVRYKKDSSEKDGSDRGWVTLEYDWVMADGIGDVPAETAEPTCTEGVVCRYCQKVVKEALGHRVIVPLPEPEAPFTVENNSAVPFVLTGGVYYSNNHESSSTSELLFRAKSDCTLTLFYGVSSEQNYDKLTVLLNGTTKHTISGLVSNQTMALTLKTGDFITVRYSKDGSVNKNDDRGWAFVTYETGPSEETVPADTLEPDCTHGVVCDFCEAVVKEALGHAFDSVVTEPTCTVQGYTTKTCTVCAHVERTDIVSALGHTEITDVGVVPTCTEPGLSDGSHCETCGEILQAQEVLEASGHTPVTDAGMAPTCTEPGLSDGIHCETCGEILQAQEVLEASGHTPVTDAGMAPTCTEPGLTEGSHCEVCGEILQAQEVLEAPGHAPVTDAGMAPTCTEPGLTEGSHCETCGEILSEQESIPATGEHSYANGVCTVCGGEDPEHVQIRTQPADFEGLVGETAVFTVEADRENVTYQWYYSDNGGESWRKASSTSAAYAVEFKSYRNGYQYRCEITDSEGNSVTSDAAVLTAAAMELAILTQPVDCAGAVNDELSFTLEATGNGLVYQWYYSGNGAVWQKSYTPGYDTGTLNPILRTYRDGYRYKCVITDVFGGTVESDAVTMTVKSSDVTVTAQPTAVENGIFSQLYTFAVAAEGENLTYCWEYSADGGSSWQQSWNEGYDTAVLKVRLYANRSGNLYRCRITSGQKITAVSEAAALQMQAESVVLLSQPKDVHVLTGESVSFHVDTEGMDLVYAWYRTNDGGSTWTQTWLPGFDSDTLTFAATAGRAAVYKCKITDGSGKTVWSEPASLKVLSAVLQITAQPESITCAVGETAVFTVAAEGDTLRYRWYASSDGESWSETWMDGYNTAALTFTVTQNRASKLYQCVITDAAGNTVKTEPVSVTVS